MRLGSSSGQLPGLTQAQAKVGKRQPIQGIFPFLQSIKAPRQVQFDAGGEKQNQIAVKAAHVAMELAHQRLARLRLASQQLEQAVQAGRTMGRHLARCGTGGRPGSLCHDFLAGAKPVAKGMVDRKEATARNQEAASAAHRMGRFEVGSIGPRLFLCRGLRTTKA